MVKAFLVLFLLTSCAVTWAQLDESPIGATKTVRFYKVNRSIQATRIWFTDRAASQAGCHNFIRKVRLHRLVQLGFQRCHVYTQKSCQAQSIVSALREPDDDASANTELTQGVSWFFTRHHPRGTRVKSWFCE